MSYQTGTFEQEFLDPFGSRTTNTNVSMYEQTDPELPPWYSVFYTTDMTKKNGISGLPSQATTAPLASPGATPNPGPVPQGGVGPETIPGPSESYGIQQKFRAANETVGMMYQHLMQLQSTNNMLMLMLIFVFLIVVACLAYIMGRQNPLPPLAPAIKLSG